MNQYLYRSILKEISKLKTLEPKLANYLREILAIHINKGRQNQKASLKLGKKQKIYQLPESFLNLLKNANQHQTFKSYKSKLKLITIFTNINQFVDENFRFRPSNKSLQMKLLELYKPFQDLSSENDQQFVRTIIKKIYHREETKKFESLSAFLKDIKVKQSSHNNEQSLKLVSTEMKEHIERIIKNDSDLKISKQYIKMYQYLFSSKNLSIPEDIFPSYLQSNYIFI